MERVDKKESDLIQDFLDVGCGCSHLYDGPCSERYTLGEILSFRSDCFALTKDELDLVILSKLSACMSVEEKVGKTHKHKQTKRVRNSTSYAHQGWGVCVSTFRFLHTIGKVVYCLHTQN